MYNILKHSHSGLRWILLIVLVAAVVNAFMKWRSGNAYTESDRKLGLFALIFTHIQLVLGAIIYVISPKVQFVDGFMKDSVLRFYGMEHLLMMLIAIVLITIGYSKSKRIESGIQKFKTTFIFYAIGLLLILAGIPWPFRAALGGGWF